ncbi:hypothetical protein [Colwellia sp. BRX10-4]|nr:hypothetical protein [Colwellia sp. BRX10-4]
MHESSTNSIEDTRTIDWRNAVLGYFSDRQLLTLKLSLIKVCYFH